MNELSRRGCSIIARNLPPDVTDAELREIFSEFGPILSTKILPLNERFPGAYCFINYQNIESCAEAVKHVDGRRIGSFTAQVFIGTRPGEAKSDGFQTNRSSEEISSSSGVTPPQSAFNRVNSQQGISPFQPKAIINPVEIEKSNRSKTSSSPAQPFSTPPASLDTIIPHENFTVGQSYEIYLSNHQIPNVVFVATFDDYVCATFFMQTMNKIEKTVESRGNSYNSKLTIGQICAAMFMKSWYRAQIVEIEESRVVVKFIDWGNTNTCDPVLEIRPLGKEYFDQPALCLKCVLDGIPSNEKLTDIQKKMISDILICDVKLKMTVIRIENDIHYIQLNDHQRVLNQEIRNVLTQTITRSPPSITFDMNQPEVDPTETHYVQITHYNSQLQCFQALLLRETIVTVINTLKNWSQRKLTAKDSIKPGLLVCVQSEEDDLWYRGWIRSVADRSCRVYFVDLGYEEMIPIDRLSECPDSLRTIYWLNIPIRLNNFPLNAEERDELWKQFAKNERLNMKVFGLRKEIYNVELLANDKSLTEFINEFRKREPPTPVQQTRPASFATITRPGSTIQPSISTRLAVQSTTATVSTATNVVNNLPNPIEKLPAEQLNHSVLNDQIKELLTEQRKQSKLLERVLGAINTTNALLTQLVQRDAGRDD